MDIIGGRRFLEVPGSTQFELPPLLLHGVQRANNASKMMDAAREIIEHEDMLRAAEVTLLESLDNQERRKMDLALNLVDQYLTIKNQWAWGDSILEWISQCETTFGTRPDLWPLLRKDVWPHAGRSSFVTLLEDKKVETKGTDLEQAVGLRLTFRQMPPIRCCSDQFLFYLKGRVGTSAYQAWSGMTSDPVSFPPERFSFQVISMDLELN